MPFRKSTKKRLLNMPFRNDACLPAYIRAFFARFLCLYVMTRFYDGRSQAVFTRLYVKWRNNAHFLHGFDAFT